MDATIFRFARKVLRGATCKKVVVEDGHTKYHAIPDSDVGKLLSFVPAKLELRVRRLQFWQSVARDPFLQSLDNSGTMNLQQCWVTACGCECVGKTIGD